MQASACWRAAGTLKAVNVVRSLRHVPAHSNSLTASVPVSMPGHADTGSGSSVSACEAGTFKTDAMSSAPATCPANSNSQLPGTGTTAWRAGYTGSGSSVAACVAGTFKAIPMSDAPCLTCPTHSKSPPASGALNDCVADAGHTGAGAGVTACAAGTYKNSSGSSACTACAPGKTGTGTGRTTDCDACGATSNVDPPQACHLPHRLLCHHWRRRPYWRQHRQPLSAHTCDRGSTAADHATAATPPALTVAPRDFCETIVLHAHSGVHPSYTPPGSSCVPISIPCTTPTGGGGSGGGGGGGTGGGHRPQQHSPSC